MHIVFPLTSLLALGDATQDNIQTLLLLLVITLAAALISRPLRLPYTLVLVVVGLIIGFSPLLPGLRLNSNLVLFLFLPVLLFEGAWSIDVAQLKANWLMILLLAVPGLLLSVFIIAALLHWTLGLSWMLALLFGAMISPTDPIAVLALFRQMGLTGRLRIIIEGESLFNDGVGAALFELVLGGILVSSAATETTTSAFSWLFTLGDVLWLMLGGLLLGMIVGWIVSRFLRLVDDHLIEMTITICVAYGVYLLGIALQTSGLLAVLGAGLVLGSYGRRTGFSDRALQASHDVWEFLGYVANSLLFLLLGVQIGEASLLQALLGSSLALLGVVVGRAAMIYIFVPLHDFLIQRIHLRSSRFTRFWSGLAPTPRRWRPILLFSGLRGALSVALVLSLPASVPQRQLLDSMVYVVVLVTLLGQGIILHIWLPQWRKKEQEA